MKTLAKTILKLAAFSFVAACFALPLSVNSNLMAAELIMIEQEHCPWCEAWNDEIGGIYHKTTEGKRAPLRRIDIHEEPPEDLKEMTRGNYTPTFVLWDNGKEVARLRGYPGDEFFWYLLGQMLDKLPNSDKEPTG